MTIHKYVGDIYNESLRNKVSMHGPFVYHTFKPWHCRTVTETVTEELCGSIGRCHNRVPIPLTLKGIRLTLEAYIYMYMYINCIINHGMLALFSRSFSYPGSLCPLCIYSVRNTCFVIISLKCKWHFYFPTEPCTSICVPICSRSVCMVYFWNSPLVYSTYMYIC